jgi:hypothetical protein
VLLAPSEPTVRVAAAVPPFWTLPLLRVLLRLAKPRLLPLSLSVPPSMVSRPVLKALALPATIVVFAPILVFKYVLLPAAGTSVSVPALVPPQANSNS